MPALQLEARSNSSKNDRFYIFTDRVLVVFKNPYLSESIDTNMGDAMKISFSSCKVNDIW